MKENLIRNIKSLLKSAEIVYKTKDYTSSTVLYFKVLFGIFDYLILIKKGKIPKNHDERFRVLESSFPDLYKILDKYYPVYRKTYSFVIDKETCEVIKENVERVIKEQKIPL